MEGPRRLEAAARVKAVLGTSDATGGALVPGNTVAGITERAATRNVFRQAMNVVTGIRGDVSTFPTR